MGCSPPPHAACRRRCRQGLARLVPPPRAPPLGERAREWVAVGDDKFGSCVAGNAKCAPCLHPPLEMILIPKYTVHDLFFGMGCPLGHLVRVRLSSNAFGYICFSYHLGGRNEIL